MPFAHPPSSLDSARLRQSRRHRRHPVIVPGEPGLKIFNGCAIKHGNKSLRWGGHRGITLRRDRCGNVLEYENPCEQAHEAESIPLTVIRHDDSLCEYSDSGVREQCRGARHKRPERPHRKERSITQADDHIVVPKRTVDPSEAHATRAVRASCL